MNNVIPLYDYNRNLPYSFNTPLIEETPESIIAKTDYKSALKLLDNISLRKHREKINEIGASVAQTYIHGLSSEDRVGLKECRVETIEKTNFLGFGRRERGIRIVFER